ncbi:MAG: flagellar motor protein PomA [Magnetococcales bacterium]|nr:MotA/TolQ/ExbB proton channel family protein [Magnetococcales bacterium]NGZ26519.1 flagellar motor protein PomA [Magnetococcales bacterium]NGZ29006.1 flagellar motor protein PomA [Magnetococcales bacterium]
MDVATIIGFVLAMLVLLGTTGGKVALFVSVHAVIVVFGGLIAATFIKFNMKDIFNVVGIISKVFIPPKDHPHKIISELVDMANIARKDGILALEKVKTDNAFMQSAINHSVDGMDPETLREILTKDIEYLAERHKVGIIMFDSMGEAAPAMGMVGTLFGMVEMLANMNDPASIGPAMATALLATTYGAVVANLLTIPMAIKLHHYSKEEQIIRQLIMDGIIGIQKGVNPRILETMLYAVLSAKHRQHS